MSVPRLRMFAGPNGSGKSTIKGVLPPGLLGVYLNPDDIQKEITELGYLKLDRYEVNTTREEILTFFQESTLLRRAQLVKQSSHLWFDDGKLHFEGVEVNAYFASVAADFLRQKLLEKRVSFSFETVSHLQTKWSCSKRRKPWATAPISTTSPLKTLPSTWHALRLGQAWVDMMCLKKRS